MNNNLRWSELCKSLNATRNIDYAYYLILDLYKNPFRSYHNFSHIEHCLKEYDFVVNVVDNPSVVEASIWMHDIIYDSKSSDNENKSSLKAIEILSLMGINSKIFDSVKKLIILTKHNRFPRTIDEKIIVDVDLAILGSSPSVFDKYERNIRKEYDWVEESLFWKSRSEFLKKFLKRKSIFSSDLFFNKYESKAIKNITNSIKNNKTKWFVN